MDPSASQITTSKKDQPCLRNSWSSRHGSWKVAHWHTYGSVHLHQSTYTKSSLTPRVLLANGVQQGRPSAPQCTVENIILWLLPCQHCLTDTSSAVGATEDAGTVGNASRTKHQSPWSIFSSKSTGCCLASKSEVQALCNIHEPMRNMLPHITSGKYIHQAWWSDGAADTDPGTYQADK